MYRICWTACCKLAILLRISVVLHRSRSINPLPHIGMQAKDKHIELSIPKRWLEEHPLTRLDLDQEAQYLKAIGYQLITTPLEPS